MSAAGATDVADAYVSSAAPTTNFGTQTTLQENGASSKTEVSYVTFDVEGLSAAPATATLRLFSGSTGATPTKVSAVSAGWTETGVIWANRPTLGAVIGSTGRLTSGQWAQADVSSAVKGDGLVSFALTTTATATRITESRTGANPPQLVLTGSVSSPPTTVGSPPTTVGSPPTTVPPTTGHVTKILTIVEENHSLAQMEASMPYLDSISSKYASASDYLAITHPSLPNYLALSSGSTHGVTADGDPSEYPISGTDIFDQALANGKTAKAYSEAMTKNCDPDSSGLYVARHNPWTYYDGATQRADCAKYDVPAGTPTSGALATDVAHGTLPNVGMLTPDLCDDAHNCALSYADNYLKSWLPELIAGPDYQSGDLVIVITADEDNDTSVNKVDTVVVSKSLFGSDEVVNTLLTHYSLSALNSRIAGAQALNNAATAPDMGAAFKLFG